MRRLFFDRTCWGIIREDASVTMPKSTDEFEFGRSGLRFAINPQFDQRSRLAAALLQGHESDVANKDNRSTHIIGDDDRLRHLRPIAACVGKSEVIDDNRQRFSIAVPDFPDSSTSDGASWSTMAQAIASDLSGSGRFALIESNLPVESNVPGEGRADALPHFDR
jgi:hypothetical protein